MRSYSTTTPLPSPMPVLLLLVGSATAVWITTESPANGFMVLAAVLLPLGIYWLSRNLEFAVIGLIVAAAVPRFSFAIGALNAKLEHIMAGVVLLILLFKWKGLPQKPQWNLLDRLVAVYLALNILSSWFMSIAPGQTLRWSLQQALAIVPYFLLRVIVNDAEKFHRAVRAFLAVGVAAASFGLLCYLSYFFFHTSFGVEVNQYGDIPGTYGTMYEANLLGSFCGSAFIMMLVTYSANSSRKRLAGVFITAAAVAVSLSRAALGATVIASLAFFYVGRKMGFLDRQVLRKAAIRMGVPALILALILLPSLVPRLSLLTPQGLTSDSEAMSRVVSIVMSVDNILSHPLLGNGTSSFQLFFTYADVGNSDIEAGFWIGNIEMRILHDVGAVGMIVFTTLLFKTVTRSICLLKQRLNIELIALILSALVYCVTFQATEGTLLAFPWVHLGLIVCALSLYSGLPAPTVPEGSFEG